MAADPIPALREDAATGEAALVFADLRATQGVPFVNLIWRHLATLPGVLGPLWAAVKPLQGSVELRQAAAGLCRSVVAPDGVRQPAAVFDVVGVGGAGRQVIATLLRDYNTANATNLLSLLVACAVLDGRGGQGRALTPAAPAPGRAEAAPALPGLDALSPPIQALVLTLDQFGRFNRTEAVASLYRHLAHWPGFLAVVHAGLAAPHQDGRLRAEHARIRDRASDAAETVLLPAAATPDFPAEAELATARASIQSFTDEMIGRMVVMGETMLAMLPEHEGEAR